MLKDASHQLVVPKFSFIESLNKSHPRRSKLKLNEDRGEKALTDSRSNLAVKSKPENQSSALVNFTDTAATINPDWYQGETGNYSLNWAEVINAAVNNQASQQQQQNRHYLGKIMFGLATSYCLFIFWWVFGHHASQILTMLSGGRQVVLSPSEVQFIDYLERSLGKIDRQLAAEREAARQRDVVYVPVYTPTPATPAIPQVVANPPTTTPSIAPAPPAATPPSALKIPAPPPLPAPVSIDNSVTAKSQPKYTLIGVLELDPSRSAALVRVKGKTRRIWVGEAINAEGWVLESVGNQRATIRHNGQVRSVAVGETF